MRGRLFISLLSVLASLGLVEVLLRLAGFSYHLYPERIEFGGPDPVTIARDFLPDRRLFWVTGDYPPRLAALRQVRPRLIFMGDSCTQYGDYPRRLTGLLQQQGGVLSLPYASLGVVGWSSYQGLQQLRRDIVPLSPRVVTVYYGWNDHWYGFGIEDKDVAWVLSPVFAKLESLRVVELAMKAAVGFRQPPARPLRVSLADFKDNLRQMSRLARQHGIVLMLLTAPSSHRRGHEPEFLKLRWIENLADLVPLHQSYVNAVRQVAQEEGTPVCDLAADFDHLPPAELESAFMADGIHMTATGNEKTAEFLYRCFKRDDLISRLAAQ